MVSQLAAALQWWPRGTVFPKIKYIYIFHFFFSFPRGEVKSSSFWEKAELQPGSTRLNISHTSNKKKKKSLTRWIKSPTRWFVFKIPGSNVPPKSFFKRKVLLWARSCRASLLAGFHSFSRYWSKTPPFEKSPVWMTADAKKRKFHLFSACEFTVGFIQWECEDVVGQAVR